MGKVVKYNFSRVRSTVKNLDMVTLILITIKVVGELFVHFSVSDIFRLMALFD